MKRTPLLGLIIFFSVTFLLVLAQPRFGHAIIDPHQKPETCTSCHSQVPDGPVAGSDYMLLRDSIDDTCHICHEYDCCKLYSLGGHNHPSNIDRWDRKKLKRPKTLPLFRGYITCNTCHLHRKPNAGGYKMIRIVSVDMDRIDWTGLCQDCHVGY